MIRKKLFTFIVLLAVLGFESTGCSDESSDGADTEDDTRNGDTGQNDDTVSSDLNDGSGENDNADSNDDGGSDDRDTEDRDTEDRDVEDSDSPKVLVKDPDADAGFYTQSECVRFCELEFECLDTEEYLHGITFDCDELCAVNVPLMTCLFPYYTRQCQDMARAHYECAYGIEACGNLKLYSDGMIADAAGESRVTDYPCASLYRSFLDEWYDTFVDSYLENGICQEEITAVSEWAADLNAEQPIP